MLLGRPVLPGPVPVDPVRGPALRAARLWLPVLPAWPGSTARVGRYYRPAQFIFLDPDPLSHLACPCSLDWPSVPLQLALTPVVASLIPARWSCLSLARLRCLLRCHRCQLAGPPWPTNAARLLPSPALLAASSLRSWRARLAARMRCRPRAHHPGCWRCSCCGLASHAPAHAWLMAATSLSC